MKKITRSIIIITIGLILAVISAAFSNTGSPKTAGLNEFSNTTFFQMTATPATPQPVQDRSEIGSTDGVTIMGFIIVAIIIIPIVLERKNWSQS